MTSELIYHQQKEREARNMYYKAWIKDGNKSDWTMWLVHDHTYNVLCDILEDVYVTTSEDYNHA